MEQNNYVVSARKYRPTTFSSVVGQKNLTSTLQNAIATDRLAHSYLFCGSRGVGKTSCARIFAKTINCEHRTPQGDPCNECESCRSFNEGRSFNIIEMDAASNNGVDDMRKLTEQVMVPPTEGRYRVFIIDEVHMLSPSAFNAFLKTLEEPPSYIIFILATTEKHKIIPTILSRCQIYDFNRISVNDIVDHLENVAKQEGVTTDRKALGVIASQADGALRDALSIFDQIVASSKGNVTYRNTIENLNILDNAYFIRLMDAFAKSDVAEALLIFKEIRDKGFNTHFFINGLQTFIRDLMVAKDPRTLQLLDLTEEEKKQMVEVASRFSSEFFFMALSLINDADLKFREASNKTFLTELLLIKLCQLLSPSPVFRGKEEGHIDYLLPLGSLPLATQTVQDSGNSSTPTAENKISPQQVQVQKKKPEPVAKRHPIAPNILSLNFGEEGTTVSTVNENESAGYPKITEDNTGDAASTDIGDKIEKLKTLWKQYADSVPQKKLLVNVMNGSCPALDSESPTTLTFCVNNEIQKGILENEKPLLLPFLIKNSGISNLDLKLTISEAELAPDMWSEREVLDNMLATHPEMEKFMKDLGLSLS